MCSAPKVTQGFRAAADVMTFGSYEGARAIPGPIGSTTRTAESLVNKTAGGPGDTAHFPWDRNPDAPPSAPDLATPEPTPTLTPPTPSESAAMLRRRRLAALRMGIASTIRTSPTGDTGIATLLSPSAGAAAGAKTKLGQ